MHFMYSPIQNGMQDGTIVRLNRGAGFGYVRDRSGARQYIFVIGSAINRNDARALSEGRPVRFRLDPGGEIRELVLS
jgi:cold shock protein